MVGEEIVDLTEEARAEATQNINKMAGHPLRVIATAFYDMDMASWEGYIES